MALLGKRDLIEAHLDPPPGPELVEGLAGPLIGHPLVGIHELVHAHACERPRAPALTCGAETLSYAELDSRVGVLARALRRRGLDRGTVAGVCLPRSADLVVAVLAVLRARAAFLPLDPDHPAERLEHMVTDSGARTVITTLALAPRFEGVAQVLTLDSLPAPNGRAAFECPPVQPDDLAYVIYTSGSTGRPKGVMVQHRGLCNVIGEQRRLFGCRADDAVLQCASMSFDAAFSELTLAFGAGAHLVMRPARLEDLAASMRRGVSVAILTPSLLANLRAADLRHLRLLVTAGEAVRWELLTHVPPGCRVLNAYGPTECSIWATWCDLGTACQHAQPPIGRPIASTRVYLLDEGGALVPDGAEGELHIAGVGVSRGYANRPELTAERFVPDPWGEPGALMYRTGDIGRVARDGEIEFLGRRDDQVKVRGHRIELGEVEAALARHELVGHAAVLAREAAGGLMGLVAYVSPRDAGRALPPGELRAHAGRLLPPYMVPQEFVVLDALPLTVSGKVDRRALRELESQPPQADGTPPRANGTPQDDVEALVAGVWRDVLGVNEVHREQSFLRLGGHSLLAMIAAAHLGQALGRPVAVQDVLGSESLADLARSLGRVTR